MVSAASKSNPGYIRHKILKLRLLYTGIVRNTTVWIRTVDRILRELSRAITGYLQRVFRALRKDDRTCVPSLTTIMSCLNEVCELVTPIQPEEKFDLVECSSSEDMADEVKRNVWVSELSDDEVDEASLMFDAKVLSCTHLLKQIEVPTTMCDPPSTDSDHEDPTPIASSTRKKGRKRRGKKKTSVELDEKKPSVDDQVLDDMSKKYGFDVKSLSPSSGKCAPLTNEHSMSSTVSTPHTVDVSRLVALYDIGELNIDIVPHLELRQLYKFLLKRDPSKKYPEIHELLMVDFEMMRDEPQHFNQPVTSYFDNFSVDVSALCTASIKKNSKARKKR